MRRTPPSRLARPCPDGRATPHGRDANRFEQSTLPRAGQPRLRQGLESCWPFEGGRVLHVSRFPLSRDYVLTNTALEIKSSFDLPAMLSPICRVSTSFCRPPHSPRVDSSHNLFISTFSNSLDSDRRSWATVSASRCGTCGTCRK